MIHGQEWRMGQVICGVGSQVKEVMWSMVQGVVSGDHAVHGPKGQVI